MVSSSSFTGAKFVENGAAEKYDHESIDVVAYRFVNDVDESGDGFEATTQIEHIGAH